MNSSVLIYRAVSTVTVTVVTTLTTGCLTSVWILMSVWKADLTVTRVSILKEGNETVVVSRFMLLCFSLNNLSGSLDLLLVCSRLYS